MLIDKLTREETERWKERELLATPAKAKDERRDRELAGDRYRPRTVNTVLAILGQITEAASDTFNIADPCRRLNNVSKRLHRTYTYEEPNALKPEDVPRSSTRCACAIPISTRLCSSASRRDSDRARCARSARGPNSDIKWTQGKLLVRRSHTHRNEVMDATKTNRDQVIALDQRQLDVLRWHVERLERERERETREAVAGERGRDGGVGAAVSSCADEVE